MGTLLNLVKALPVLAGCVMGAASYPPIPSDLTTPVQQRLAINGANGEFSNRIIDYIVLMLLHSHLCRLEHLRAIEPVLRSVWHLQQCSYPGGVLEQISHLSYLKDLFQCGHSHWLDSGHDLLLQNCVDQL